ncbi:MAG: hypothetical protein HOQ02_04625 [Lysobacter sp.]|nr:hypothetical protein [Lysobacter sp.]
MGRRVSSGTIAREGDIRRLLAKDPKRWWKSSGLLDELAGVDSQKRMQYSLTIYRMHTVTGELQRRGATLKNYSYQLVGAPLVEDDTPTTTLPSVVGASKSPLMATFGRCLRARCPDHDAAVEECLA